MECTAQSRKSYYILDRDASETYHQTVPMLSFAKYVLLLVGNDP